MNRVHIATTVEKNLEMTQLKKNQNQKAYKQAVCTICAYV